jgi:hypothetical protein
MEINDITDLKAYLMNTNEIQDVIIFAKDLAEAESKINGIGNRMKIMDWIPIKTEHPEVLENSKWFLAECAETTGVDKGKLTILLVKARSLTEVSQICEDKIPSSFIVQGIESIDLDIIE